jgi:hypothetical protein
MVAVLTDLAKWCAGRRITSFEDFRENWLRSFESTNFSDEVPIRGTAVL